jgi:hypothetical protein
MQGIFRYSSTGGVSTVNLYELAAQRPARDAGSDAASITAARQLYAILTGRISEVRGIARLNETTGEYEYLGQAVQRARQRQIGLWLADSWRMGPTRTKDNWRTNDYNEINIIENGFVDEFKLAMVNLQANNSAGGMRAGSFAYFGPGTGTAPLPIFLAYFNGIGRDRAGDSSLYTSTQSAYEVTQLVGGTQARIVQLVSRVRW